MADRIDSHTATHEADPALIAIVDIGKTNAKLVLIETGTGRIAWHAEHAIESIPGPVVRQLDLASVERWLRNALANAPCKERIRTIVPVAHGAAAVLLDRDGHVVSAPDYEDPVFDSIAEEYRPYRDEFSRTYSPSLPLGLNLGRQLFFIQRRQPDDFAKVARILPLPQYWASRLCGVEACELTSLGCHTDLWQPLARRFSMLAEREGWSHLFPPIRSAADPLGPITPAVRAATGLDASCRVLCGIHDSNASYLAHAAARRGTRDLAVISSGTWTVIMADRDSLEHLDEARDMLANVDAFGAAVGTARFMGGREYAAIAGPAGTRADATLAALERVLAIGAMALPCFTPAGGPFAGHSGQLSNDESLTAAERAALATLYVALMTDLRLDELRAGNTIVVDGPLASNPLFARLLTTLRPGSRVSISDARLACCAAAHYLATGRLLASTVTSVASPFDSPALLDHRDRWRHGIATLR